jgi:hypothetical protein
MGNGGGWHPSRLAEDGEHLRMTDHPTCIACAAAL